MSRESFLLAKQNPQLVLATAVYRYIYRVFSLKRLALIGQSNGKMFKDSLAQHWPQPIGGSHVAFCLPSKQ